LALAKVEAGISYIGDVLVMANRESRKRVLFKHFFALSRLNWRVDGDLVKIIVKNVKLHG